MISTISTRSTEPSDRCALAIHALCFLAQGGKPSRDANCASILSAVTDLAPWIYEDAARSPYVPASRRAFERFRVANAA